MAPLEHNGIRSSPAPGPATATAPGTQPGPEKTGVLVVDDDHLVRIMVLLGLERHGFDVWTASSGREALRLYQANRDRINVVLLDTRMPDLDGTATLAALRLRNPDVLACFMSDETGEEEREALRQRGALYVFVKPFMLDHLANILRLAVHGVPSNLLPSERVQRE